MTRRLSVAHLTAIDHPPVALIEAAAEAGFDGVGLRLIQVTPDSPGYPLADRKERAAVKSALAATGIVVTDIEFIRITPEFRVEDVLAALDTGADLGARHVISAPYDDDHMRLSDRLGALSEAADDRGLRAVLEFFPWTSVPDLATCWSVVAASGPKTGLLIDSLHFDRSGSTLAQIREIPAERLPFSHLCDAPVHPPYTTDDLLDAARRHRLTPGEGQIDLTAFVTALPTDTPLGLEVPCDGPDASPLVDRLRRLHVATQGICDAAMKSAKRTR